MTGPYRRPPPTGDGLRLHLNENTAGCSPKVLEAIARGDPPAPGKQVELAPAEHRRNLTTRGVPLGHLVGKRFKVGEVVLTGGRLNFPCRYLEKLLGRPVYTPLLNRSGLNCRIEVGGIIRKGDPITPLED